MKCRSCKKRIIKPRKILKKYPLYLWPCTKKERLISKNLIIYECNNCKLIQLQRFKEKFIKIFNSQSEHILTDKKKLLERITLIKKNVKNYKKNFFLEIGGGRNSILKSFKGINGYISDLTFKNKEKNFRYIKKDFLKTKFKKNFFDYIFFFHTLEHIENPGIFLNKVRENLKHSGFVILEVPNINYHIKNNSSYAFFFQHQSLFDLKSLTNIMNLNGFKFVKLLNNKNNKEVILAIFKKDKFKKKLNKKKYNEEILSKIINNIKTKVKKLKGFITKNNFSNIGIYGCGGNSLTMHYHVKQESIDVKYFFDKSKVKLNKYIPLTDKLVQNTNKINDTNLDMLIFTNNKIMQEFKKKFKKIKTYSLS